MAPTVAGTNRLTQAQDDIIDHLANLTAFQTFSGTGNATDAKDHIHVEAFGDVDIDVDFPYVLISPQEGNPQIMFVRHASPYEFITTHYYMLSFWRTLTRPTATTVEDREREWANLVADVMQEFVDDTVLPGKFGANVVSPAAPATFNWEDSKQFATQVWDWNIENTVEQTT